MVDNEKRDNLANARRKLKKFRDQQQQNGNDHLTFISETNGTNVHASNGISNEPAFNYNTTVPRDIASFVNEQQSIFNGIHANLSKSPVAELEEQQRQYALLIENQKQQRARLEDQRQYSVTSSMSGRSSQAQLDPDFIRQIDQKYRRDFEHLQEQLEIHVQTIGILVAEKSDLSAQLSQSKKQLERKQGEMDEIQGRLKASRERVEELEKHTQNSTSNAQKREMAAKESDKEIDRLKNENNRQIQIIEDLKQNLNEINEKYQERQNLAEQLNNDLTKLKQKLEQSEIRLQQYQSMSDTAIINQYEQQFDELQKIILSKTNEIDALQSLINQMRLDNEQVQTQYQQYNANVQRHIQELNEQINQLVQTNNMLENEREAMKKSYEMKLIEIQNDQTNTNNTNNNELIFECESLRQQNQSFQNVIENWSKQYEEIRLLNEQLSRQLMEKDQYITEFKQIQENVHENPVDHEKLLQTIHEDKTTLSRAITQNKQLKEQLTELQDQFIKITNDNMNLTNQLQAQEYLNKQLNERFTQKELHEQVDQTTVNSENHIQSQTVFTNEQDNTTAQLNQLLEENKLLQERLSQLEHQSQSPPTNTNNVPLNDSGSLSSLTSAIDDTPQLQNGFIEKIIDRFNRAMRDNADLQDRTQQLEHLILQLQSETDTIGDYISLYQQQRQQLHRRYQEKDEYIKQLTHDRLGLQRKLSELETLLMRGLNKSSTNNGQEEQKTISDETVSTNQQPNLDENEWPEMIDNAVSSTEQTTNPLNDDKIIDSSSVPSLSNFDNETKTRILTLLKELGQDNSSSPQTDTLSTTKLAFIGKNLYVCPACTGPVQWV